MTTAVTAPATAQPEQTEAEHEVDTDAIVGDLFPELRAEGTEEPAKSKAKPANDDADEETEEPEAEQTEEAKTDPFSLLRLDELFSDKALNTKAGIAKARETILQGRKAAREMQLRAQDIEIKAKRREVQAKRDRVEANRAMRAAQAIEARVQADVDTAFNSGDAGAVRDAISRLTKRDASRIYEQWTEAELGKKKLDNAPKDPRLDTVLEKLAKLEKGKEEEQTQQQQAQHARAVQNWLAGLDADVAKNADTYPTVAHLLTLEGKPRELADHVYELATAHHKATGEWPSNAQILNHVEKQLKGLVRVPKKPATEQPQKNSKLPGRGVNPALGSQRSVPKHIDEMTQEEREEKFNEDADEILGGLGLLG